MATFELASGWNDTGYLDGSKYNNHESNLDGEEMKTLAAQTITIPGFDTIAAPAAGNDPFYDLSQALKSAATIEIVKGIHQRPGGDVNVHFTLRVKGTTRQFHVFVGEGATGTLRVISPSKSTFYDRLIFQYKCTGVSYVRAKTVYLFPPVFAMTGVRGRGHSFSSGNTKPQMSGAEMVEASRIPAYVPAEQRTGGWR